MDAVNGPIRFGVFQRYRTPWLGAFATVALLTGCAAGPGTGPPSGPETSSQPSAAVPVTTAPASNTESSTPAPTPTQGPASSTGSTGDGSRSVDTSKWKAFNTSGVQFRYPPGWVVKEDECDDCGPGGDPAKNPYARWELISDHGITTLDFAADTAVDTDGDTNTYKRTELERTQVPGPLKEPALLVAEHQQLTSGDDGARKSKLVVFVIDAAEYAQRSEKPELAFFHPASEQWSMMQSTDDFVFDFGIDEDAVSLKQARELLATDEYALMRAIMLSVKTRE